MTLATAEEIAGRVIPPALAEWRQGRIGRTNWGVEWKDDLLQRKSPTCAVCPMAAYLLSKQRVVPRAVLINHRALVNEEFSDAAARIMTTDLGKIVTPRMIHGFINSFDRIESIIDDNNDLAMKSIGRRAAELVEAALNAER